jgi:lysozyme
MVRTLQLGDDGPEVEEMQRALNARGQARYYPPLRVDGRLGPRTMWAYQDLGWALGLLPETLNHGITPGAQALLTDPSKRSQAQLDRARDRSARMATRTIAFDGAPIFWGLAKALQRARDRGWGGTLNSADRRKGVAERYGKQSQARLRWCFEQRRDTGRCPCPSCNPANRPGQSSHELRSDGTAFPGPVGRALHWWELGLDCSDSDQLVALLKTLGYKIRKPYSSPSEAHHVNFKRDPGPVVSAPPDAGDMLDDVQALQPADSNPADDFIDDAVAEPIECAEGDEPTEDDAASDAAEDLVEDAAALLADDDTVEVHVDVVVSQVERAAELAVAAPALQGIDVSVYQGDIDWKKVRRAGYRFAFVRATVGASPSDNDRNFGAGRLNAMREAGIVRGYYHVAYPSGGDALTEARHAVKTIKDAGGLVAGDLPLALDLEKTSLGPAATYTWASDFCTEVDRLTGRGCILYTYPHFWKTKVGNPTRPPNQGAMLWIAHYEVATPAVPRAWGHRGWSFWQYTSSGSCPGIRGKVDLNHWHGTLAAFNELLID